jgi:hypothetical protein
MLVQKMAHWWQIKSSALAVKSERLQQVPALKRELEEKDDLIAALAEQLAAARESATGSSRQHQEELARLKSEYFFSVFCTNLVLLFALRLYNLAL